MKELKTIQEIKQAVDNGQPVYCGNMGYEVIKDRIGQYLIRCNLNGYCIGLTDQSGTKLNGTTFYTKQQ